MILECRVVPNAKKNNVEQVGQLLKIHLTAVATDGKANKALVQVISDKFGVKKGQVEIIKGLKSRQKTVRINTL